MVRLEKGPLGKSKCGTLDIFIFCMFIYLAFEAAAEACLFVLQRLKCVVNERWLVLRLGKDIESTTKEAFYPNCLE